MTDEILKRMISSFMALDMNQYSFGWQGGEPTLMGLDFFRQVIKYQQQFGKSGNVVSNGLQTNGVLLDDEWCRHLAKYQFLVGLSIDGPEEIHDQNRLTASSQGSHALVMKSFDALKRNHVEFNVLTLVSSSNMRKPLLIYNYLKELGVNFHQYIECIEFNQNGELEPWSVTPEAWGEFLCQIFDEWYKHDRFKVSIRLFDSILTRMVDGFSNVCAMGNDCRQYLVVEHNGNVYPCDFFVLPELKLGNIMENEWEDFINSPVYEEFGSRKSRWNEKCKTCPYLKFCAGCCPKNRLNKGVPPERLSILCKGWEMFYKHSLTRFKSLAERVIQDRQKAAMKEQAARQTGAFSQVPHNVGRNSPCPCGSGKKFKKCCGK